MTRMTAYGFVLITLLFTVVGQVLIKWQAMQAGTVPSSWSGRASFLLTLLLNPWIMAGLFSAVIAACAWMMAMTRLPLTIGYPMMSLAYPLVVLASWLLFGESISIWRGLGVVLILAGISLLGKG